MKLLEDALFEIKTKMQENGVPFAQRQAEELLCDLLSLEISQLRNYYSLVLTEEQWVCAQKWLARRLEGEPLAYICGKVQFYGCLIKVNPTVLIPWQETEILVDKIVQELKSQPLNGKVLWDVCCGSGCIGIALKKQLPGLSVILSDFSHDALAVASENARLNAVDVKLLQGDLFSPFQGMKADFIVSNPPYISEIDYEQLEEQVKSFEPSLALKGGENGLLFYERFAQELPVFLQPKGHVWLEIGYDQGDVINKIFKDPCWVKKKVENDWSGHNRFFFLENE